MLDDVEKRSFTPQDPDDGMNFNLSDSQVLEGAVVTVAAVGEEVGDIPQHLSLLHVFSALDQTRERSLCKAAQAQTDHLYCYIVKSSCTFSF